MFLRGVHIVLPRRWIAIALVLAVAGQASAAVTPYTSRRFL
jgi:hypothetical protein